MLYLIQPDHMAVLTIEAEAGNQSFLGKVAVAEVIRNRMRRRYTSDGTIVGTVLAPFQFSCWNTNDPNRIRVFGLPIYKLAASLEAWILSIDSNHTKGAVLYHTKSVAPKWKDSPKVKQVTVIGDHIFYDEVP